MRRRAASPDRGRAGARGRECGLLRFARARSETKTPPPVDRGAATFESYGVGVGGTVHGRKYVKPFVSVSVQPLSVVTTMSASSTFWRSGGTFGGVHAGGV